MEQEGQHLLTGQRATPISDGTYRRHRTLVDGYLESPFPTACLLLLKWSSLAKQWLGVKRPRSSVRIRKITPARNVAVNLVPSSYSATKISR